ncbi:unnamed protein product [Mycena citricolor]|uniref:Cell cycle checkpoint control protein RAD9A n=1 Tax=Mycena citricolor TaxID=2018698 RepID=A0AAD2K6E4_9AGAR|nr:unnamed protein product [Mycena citricolor]
MNATLDASALKPFTRGLACLARYGDDLAIYATEDSLSLSTTNSSKSAYGRFKYGRQFFSKYSVESADYTQADDEEGFAVTGQILAKSLLSILKHRTIEKNVERCEMSIVEGSLDRTESDDSLESRLIIRLHCKHGKYTLIARKLKYAHSKLYLGVVKTHRLVLLNLTSFLAPGVPNAQNESHLTVGPRAIRDMIEYFPMPKGTRSDPQLVWNFGESEVEVKSYESSLDTKGRNQLSTELSISADEFDLYDLCLTPTSIAFHLREFNATIAFAESMSLALELRFTDPAAPLFIDVEGDNVDTLFVISTSQVPGAPAASQASTSVNPRKRVREETPRDLSRIKKPMKAVQRTDAAALAHSETDRASRSQSTMPRGSMLPPASIPDTHQNASMKLPGGGLPEAQSTPRQEEEPLFLPFSSQLSIAETQVLKNTGLGFEDMDVNELSMLLDDEGLEVGQPEDEELEFAATQPNLDTSGFNPLWED